MSVRGSLPLLKRTSLRELHRRLKTARTERDNFEVILAALILNSGESLSLTTADLEATKDVKRVIGSATPTGYDIKVEFKQAQVLT